MTGLSIHATSLVVNANCSAIPMETTQLSVRTDVVQNNVTQVAQSVLTQHTHSLDRESQHWLAPHTRRRISLVGERPRMEELMNEILLFNQNFLGSFSLERVRWLRTILDHFRLWMRDSTQLQSDPYYEDALQALKDTMLLLVAHGEASSWKKVVRKYHFLTGIDFCCPVFQCKVIQQAMAGDNSEMLLVVLESYLWPLFVNLPALIKFANQQCPLVSLTDLLATAKRRGFSVEDCIVKAWSSNLSVRPEVAPVLLDQLSSPFLIYLVKLWITDGTLENQNLSVDCEHLLRMVFRKMKKSITLEELRALFEFLLLKNERPLQCLTVLIEENSVVFTDADLIKKAKRLAQEGNVYALQQLLFLLKHLNLQQESLNRLVSAVRLIRDGTSRSMATGVLVNAFALRVDDSLLGKWDLNRVVLDRWMEGILREQWGVNSARALQTIFQRIKAAPCTKKEVIEYLVIISSFCNRERRELLYFFRREFSDWTEFLIPLIVDRGSTDIWSSLMLLRNLGVTSSQLETVCAVLCCRATAHSLPIVTDGFRAVFPHSEFPAMESLIAALESQQEANILSRVSDRAKELIYEAKRCVAHNDLERLTETLSFLKQEQLSYDGLDIIFSFLNQMSQTAQTMGALGVRDLLIECNNKYKTEGGFVVEIEAAALKGDLDQLKHGLHELHNHDPWQSTLRRVRCFLEQRAEETGRSDLLEVWREVFPEEVSHTMRRPSVALSE